MQIGTKWWKLVQISTNWCTLRLCLCGELHFLFFYCAMNTFPTKNSFLTLNSVMHALELCPMWCTHYVWQALLFLSCTMNFFQTVKPFPTVNSDTHTSALPHVTHALHVASSTRSFPIVLWTLFWQCTLWCKYALQLRPMWCMHCVARSAHSFSFTVKSIPTMNSRMHALWLQPVWGTHYGSSHYLSIVPWTLFQLSSVTQS